MTTAGPLSRLRRLSAERRRLLLRAIALLPLASAGMAVLPFRRAIRFGCVPSHERHAGIDDVIWAVETAARYVPLRTMCIEKGLVVQRMLRSGGVDATLHYGARHHPRSGKLEAHVWVTAEGEYVIGGEEAAGFREIATFR